MQLPLVHGEFCQKDFFIYSAADEKYFDEFVPALSKSIKTNTPYNFHLHLYNPRPDQLEFCKNNRITWTAEYVPFELFTETAKKFEKENLDEPRTRKISFSKSVLNRYVIAF